MTGISPASSEHPHNLSQQLVKDLSQQHFCAAKTDHSTDVGESVKGGIRFRAGRPATSYLRQRRSPLAALNPYPGEATLAHLVDMLTPDWTAHPGVFDPFAVDPHAPLPDQTQAF